MEESAYYMDAIAGVIYLVVGVRLFLLSRRTRQAPEYFIALAFMSWGLGYALYDIPYAFTEGDESIAPFFAYSSLAVIDVGIVAFALFTKNVFRKQERWAHWLVLAIAAGLVLGSAGTAWVGDWEQVDPLANPGAGKTYSSTPPGRLLSGRWPAKRWQPSSTSTVPTGYVSAPTTPWPARRLTRNTYKVWGFPMGT